MNTKITMITVNGHTCFVQVPVAATGPAAGKVRVTTGLLCVIAQVPAGVRNPCLVIW